MATASGLPVREASIENSVAGFGYNGIGILTGFQQLLDHGRVAVSRRQRERSGAETVSRFDVGSGANQQVGGFEIVLADGPVKCGGSIRLLRVDSPLLLEKRTDWGVFPRLTRVRQPGIGLQAGD